MRSLHCTLQDPFRFWAQFIRKSVNHRIMQSHFNPLFTKNEEVAVTVSVAGAVLCFSARVCKHQRRLERVCNGQPKKKHSTAVIGPARSLDSGITNKLLLHSGIMQRLSIYPKRTSIIDQLSPSHASLCNIVSYPNPTFFQGNSL